jgi:hypothetical protein
MGFRGAVLALIAVRESTMRSLPLVDDVRTDGSGHPGALDSVSEWGERAIRLGDAGRRIKANDRPEHVRSSATHLHPHVVLRVCALDAGPTLPPLTRLVKTSRPRTAPIEAVTEFPVGAQRGERKTTGRREGRHACEDRETEEPRSQSKQTSQTVDRPTDRWECLPLEKTLRDESS